MAVSQGIFKQTRIARQSAKGTLALVGGGAIIRREQSTFELAKESYTTESEITATQQITSSRHGVRTVNGKLTGIFSPGTYADPLSAVLRKDFTAVTSLTGLSITVAGTPGAYTLTTTGLLAGGIKVGMVIRITAGTGLNADVLNKNLLVTACTATVATVAVLNGSTITTGSGTTCTIAIPGKISYTPVTGHTSIYHTVEEWYPDVPFSERNLDVKFTQANLSLPGTGNAKIDFTAIGLNQTNAPTAYFTAPTAETTTDSLVAASGLLLVGGVPQATITDLNIAIDGKGAAADGVVGSDIRPDVFVGKVSVSGSFTAYFDSSTVPSMFVNETATSIVSALTAGTAANADFVTLTMSNVRINSSTPGDNETGLKRTYNFVAVLNAAGGSGTATEKTTLFVQDSAAA